MAELTFERDNAAAQLARIRVSNGADAPSNALERYSFRTEIVAAPPEPAAGEQA